MHLIQGTDRGEENGDAVNASLTWQVPSAGSDPLVASPLPLPSLPHSVTDAFLPTPTSPPSCFPAWLSACRPRWSPLPLWFAPVLLAVLSLSSLCSPNSIACCCSTSPLPPTDRHPAVGSRDRNFFLPRTRTRFFRLLPASLASHYLRVVCPTVGVAGPNL